MNALAVVFDEPQSLALRALPIDEPGDADVIIAVQHTGISTGTERLLYTGTMPPFPGLGYPLVPGYESVGVITHAGPLSKRKVDDQVFVAGARCFGETRGLFGGAAERLVVAGERTHVIPSGLGDRGVLLSLAATALHALRTPHDHALPDLIVGHGSLARLAARLVLALGGPAPTVWEINPARVSGAEGYAVTHPDHDPRRDYHTILELSGAHGILDTLIARLARNGRIVLGGFYHEPVAFAFPLAFMRAMQLLIAAEFTPTDLADVTAMVTDGRLSLDNIITHRVPAADAAQAYATAFGDATCVKMILNWSHPE
ncbi:MAG TPA: chlorophyll synthesis pathway protein BchC [Gemmatimonadaceae bacterium]|nr:chlorophyll synthesis pathway protein BchC [Gemmatimonadaceae bacterium]